MVDPSNPLTMQTHPVASFPVAELADRSKLRPDGKRRKPPVEDLAECELLELVQYDCVDRARLTAQREVYIECLPLVRLFRRCSGGLMVETTAWEDKKS